MNLAEYIEPEKLAELRANEEQRSLVMNHIAKLEIEKVKTVDNFLYVEQKLTVLRKEISEKYGEGCKINLETGEVIPAEAEVVDESN